MRLEQIKTIGLIFLSALMSMTVWSCSDDNDEPDGSVEVTESDIVGSWSDKDEPYPIYFVFESGHTGILIETGYNGQFESLEFIWTLKNGIISLTYGGTTEKLKLTKITHDKILVEDDDEPWMLYRVSTSDVPTGGSATVDPAYAPYVGTWTGTDGYDVVAAEFGADGSYTDWLVVNGRRTEEVNGKYSVNGSTVTIPTGSNLSNIWGTTYTVKFNSSGKMTWTNSQMSGGVWNESWVFEKE